MMAERIEWLDVFKAVLILFMVMGHAGTPFVTYIYLFHMSAFFMISGYTFRGEKYSIIEFVKRKCLTLLFPAYLINMVYILFYWGLQKMGLYSFVQAGEAIALKPRVEWLIRAFVTTDLGGATWFFVVLFQVEILFRLFTAISKAFRNENLIFLLAAAAGACSYGLKLADQTLPYMMDLALMACLYYGIGLAAARTGALKRLYRRKQIWIPVCLILTYYFGHIYFKGTLPMNWPSRNFKNVFLQLIAAFGPTCLTACLAVGLNKTKAAGILRWIGKHTYCIVATHFAVFRLLFLAGIGMKWLPIEQLQLLTPMKAAAQNGGWLLITALTVAVCCGIAWLAEQWKMTDYLLNARMERKRSV